MIKRPLPGRRVMQNMIAAASALLIAQPLTAQTTAQPRSYTDYYHQHRQQTHTTYMTPRQYTYNKYFAQNPAISPYSNLVRPTSPYVPKYQTYVQPEIQRRAAQQMPHVQPQMQPRAPVGSQYHNKWYANGGQLPR